ncbi:MAG TPA: hypothetical protein QGF58_27980 [Myxococcota bacterium]|nr:hypothetical protein [Myxococcota bacterium]
MWLLLACTDEPTPAATPEDIEALQVELEDLREEVAALQEELGSVEGHERYEDAEAVAAVQNEDPWANDEPNIQSLWSSTDNGYWWFNDSEWVGDNRNDPPGEFPATELIELYHETTECEEGFAFADCNATGGIKMYVNGPRITDNDWSADGLRNAAIRRYHTHTSGMYLVSFGQLSTVTDYGQLIAPSGIHLEPHGSHQAIRIDGSANAGDNIRIDLSKGATGLAIYTGDEASYCEDLGRDCSTSYPLYLRGGVLHLEDLRVETSVDEHQGVGAFTLASESLGVRRLMTWSWVEEESVYAHCVFNDNVGEDSLVFVAPYGLAAMPLDVVLVDVWGPGDAPTACTETQMVTTSAGTYGYGSWASVDTAHGGFRVALVDSTGSMTPSALGEDYAVFAYQIVEPL